MTASRPCGLSVVDRRVEASLERAELVVDRDAQRLKRPRRGMDPTPLRSQRLRHRRHQVRRALESAAARAARR